MVEKEDGGASSVEDQAVVNGAASVSAVPASVPSADVIDEIVSHLGAALMQTIPTDDQIIIGHVRSAHHLARLLRKAV